MLVRSECLLSDVAFSRVTIEIAVGRFTRGILTQLGPFPPIKLHGW
jgi:hypothetical protein